MENIIFGNIRVQIFSGEIVRIEHAGKGGLCDKDTFFIPDRAQYADTHIGYSQEGNVVCFGEYELYLPENGRSLSGVKLEKNGRRVYTYRGQQNSGELPPLDQTPEVFAVVDCPRILVPDGGYSAERKGEYVVEEDAQDIYLLLCGKDYKKLRRLYVELTGRSELVRLSTLGGWNSKYYAYTEEEAKQLILDYEAHDVPLDNMVIDTDWRDCADGWGYDINTGLFPDMKRFLDFAHAHGVEIMFNDHPEPVEGAHVFEPREIAYREEKLQSLMELGLETLVLLSKKKPDSHIVVDVEFGEGEGKISLKDALKRTEGRKPKSKTTYKDIQNYVEENYGFKVHTAYIAEVKRNLGLPMYDAPNAVEELKRPRSHPTEKMVLAIKETLAHFEII